MKIMDAIIIAFSDGEMVEVEFWRRSHDGQTCFHTYDATPWTMGRVFAALKNEKIFTSHCDFSGPEGDMTLHLEV